MPPPLQTSQIHTQNKRSQRQRTGSDEDEDRLLGGPRKHDPEAVVFQKPGAGRQTRVMVEKPYSGRFQVRNTLANTKNRNSPSLRTTRAGKPQLQSSLPVLQFEASRGANVKSNLLRDSSDESNTQPLAKRCKPNNQLSRSEPSSDDPLDNLNTNEVHITAKPHNLSSIHSHGNGLLRQSSGPRPQVAEYRSVERMMGSRPSVPRAEHSMTKDSPVTMSSNVSRPSNSPPTTNLVDMTIDDDSRTSHSTTNSKLPQTMSNGTIRKAVSTVHRTTSPYFAQVNGSALSERPKEKNLVKEVRLPYSDSAQTRLSNQFVQQDGRHRGALHTVSSFDELATTNNTVGKAADRQKSPLPGDHAHSERGFEGPTLTVNSTSDIGLEPSNIKSTVFAVDKKESNRKAASSKIIAGEAEPRWGIRLSSCNGVVGTDLGLVSDDKEGDYTVQQAGKATSWHIQSSKLHKIHMTRKGGTNDGGKKVRFQSARTYHEGKDLDLEFTSEKEMTELINRLASISTCKILPHDSSWMDKAFERSRSEYNRASYHINDEPPQLADAQTSSTNIKNHGHTNQRDACGTGVVRELMTRANTSDNAPCPSSRATPLLQCQVATEGQQSRIEGLRPEHNSHLNPRRSTRASNSTQQKSEEVYANLEKYIAPKHDLGPRWKKSLSYPKESKKKVSVEYDDLSRLEEGEFLNDNLIGFYLRHLEHELEEENPDLASKTYFFNSYFYGSLTSLPKGQKTVNFDKVQSWTRKVDLFTKDYIIVPINESAHWYLAIICNLPALDRTPLDTDLTEPDNSDFVEKKVPENLIVNNSAPLSTDTTESFAELSLDNKGDSPPNEEQRRAVSMIEPEEEMLFDVAEKPESSISKYENRKITTASKKAKRKSVAPAVTHIDPSKPAIITFDSLGNPHGTVIRHLKQYLYEECKAKRGGMELDIGQIKGINARAIPLQRNFSDCGLYLLGYIQKCLQDGPKKFISKIIKREYNDDDWSSLEPSQFRTRMREHIQSLYQEQKSEQRGKAQDKAKTPASSPLGDQAKHQKPDVVNYGLQCPSNLPSPTRNDALKHARRIDEGADDSHNSPSNLSSPTRNDALKHARPIDESADDSHNMKRHKKTHNKAEHSEDRSSSPAKDSPSTIQEDPSLIVLGSQSQSQSQPFAASSQPLANSTFTRQPQLRNSLELPDEIEDSQPNEASLEIIDTRTEVKAPLIKAGTPDLTRRGTSSSPPSLAEERQEEGTKRRKKRRKSERDMPPAQHANEVIDVDV